MCLIISVLDVAFGKVGGGVQSVPQSKSFMCMLVVIFKSVTDVTLHFKISIFPSEKGPNQNHN